jgi:hypothetical protein
LLGAFLHRKALERGVHHVPRHVESVLQDERGDITGLRLAGDETLAADFFVDCSGFASLLIGKALARRSCRSPTTSSTMRRSPCPRRSDGPIMTQTVSTAMDHGWAWKIPLTERYGNGYVYSTRFCSADQAETELRARLGLLDADTPARHLKMRVGRVTHAWNPQLRGQWPGPGFHRTP